nr:hypothetical protein [Mucilaginibacter sp. X5P1]
MNATTLGYMFILVFVFAMIMQISKDRHNGG